METYKCSKCGMSVNATCGKCNAPLVNDVLKLRYGASDSYIYVCNAGTGNGTTNSTAGTLSIIIEYYGMD